VLKNYLVGLPREAFLGEMSTNGIAPDIFEAAEAPE
jgi:hypothetical protein